MAEGGLYPPVYVVDTFATRPPVPPRLKQGRRRAEVTQRLLFLLVSLALCGMAIEACFIYHLHYSESIADSPSSSKMISGEDVTASPTKRPRLVVPPSKPVAHLTDGQDVVHGSRIMSWSTAADPLLYEMDYRDKKLIAQKEGYYYVYSKVFFKDDVAFIHSVHVASPRYLGSSIPLLQSRKYSKKAKQTVRSNSYLGGVFHLYEGDALFVLVSNTTQLERRRTYENFFGAYMI